ncbi:hypothetical protein WDW89_00260 [Deltaproteobacteria bacterium TL4]
MPNHEDKIAELTGKLREQMTQEMSLNAEIEKQLGNIGITL